MGERLERGEQIEHRRRRERLGRQVLDGRAARDVEPVEHVDQCAVVLFGYIAWLRVRAPAQPAPGVR